MKLARSICYLDTVPDDSLRIVLRYLSRRPQHHDWHAYTSAHSVITGLDVGGGFARAALSEFQSIGGKNGIPLDADADASILRPLVHRLPLHRLVLKLGGGQLLPDLLRGCGAELTELVLDTGWTVVTETDILAISIHCRKLSYLAIRGYHFESPLTPIWRSLGSTLTRIYIGWYFSTFGHGILGIISVPHLVEHCVNVRHVDVLTLNHVIANVLVALGSRIRALSIEDKLVSSIAPWRKVYNACKNLETVYLKLHSSEQAIDVLSSMRTKLVSLTLDDLHNVIPTGGQFFSALSECTVLREVELHVWKMFPEALLRKLFESAQSVTTLRCIVSLSAGNPNQDVINLVAFNLRNLESFTLSTNTQLKGEYVNALVHLPRLKAVTLRAPCFKKSGSKPAEDCAVEVVKRLKDCVQLVQLDMDDINIKNRHPHGNRSQLIAEAALLYDRKDFDMFIGGVQYRTW